MTTILEATSLHDKTIDPALRRILVLGNLLVIDKNRIFL